MTSQIGTTMARRQLGKRLRRLRIEAGRTLDDIAEAQIASATKMWRIETGRISTRPGDVLALARLMDIDPRTTDELVALAGATRRTGFQHDHGSPVAEWAGMYAELEAASAAVAMYKCEMVPGLLQTPDYARAVTAANRKLDPTAVDRLVAFRLRRQQAFFDRTTPGRLDVVLTAGAYHLTVGAPSLMEAQYAHLRSMATRDHVRVRVLPADGVHAAMRGDFVIMDFPDRDDPPLVYLESLIGSRYVEETEQLVMYREAFDEITERAVPVEDYDP